MSSVRAFRASHSPARITGKISAGCKKPSRLKPAMMTMIKAMRLMVMVSLPMMNRAMATNQNAAAADVGGVGVGAANAMARRRNKLTPARLRMQPPKAIMPKMTMPKATMTLCPHQTMRMQNRKSQHEAAAAVGVVRKMIPLMVRLTPKARSTRHQPIAHQPIAHQPLMPRQMPQMPQMMARW